jgi:hypothetical protein
MFERFQIIGVNFKLTFVGYSENTKNKYKARHLNCTRRIPSHKINLKENKRAYKVARKSNIKVGAASNLC